MILSSQSIKWIPLNPMITLTLHTLANQWRHILITRFTVFKLKVFSLTQNLNCTALVFTKEKNIEDAAWDRGY